jgi:glucose-fructose oxidoreductase
MKPTNRRQFLGHLSLTTVGLTLGTRSSSRSQQQRRLGIALLGLGRYATGQLGPALLETKHCYLAGVITGHPEKAQHWAKTYNLKQSNLYSYDTIDRIADNPEIDIVYVVTPPGLHPEFTIRAAKAGKHVISEKPMATSVADCDRMIAACRAAKVKLGIGYRVHYDPYHSEMVRLARPQELGAVTKMGGTFSFVLGEREFRVDKKLGGGGPLMDLGIYLVHAACMATGAEPVAVTAHEEQKLKPELFNEVEETMRWTMEFAPQGKQQATFSGVTSFNGQGNQFRVDGEKGWIDFKQAFSYRGLVCETSRGKMQYPVVNQQAAQMDDFASCILTGRDTRVSGELGRRDMRIISAIYESARTGKRVTLQKS